MTLKTRRGQSSGQDVGAAIKATGVFGRKMVIMAARRLRARGEKDGMRNGSVVSWRRVLL